MMIFLSRISCINEGVGYILRLGLINDNDESFVIVDDRVNRIFPILRDIHDGNDS